LKDSSSVASYNTDDQKDPLVEEKFLCSKIKSIERISKKEEADPTDEDKEFTIQPLKKAKSMFIEKESESKE